MPGTRKLFLHNLLWLELITHSVHRMILLLKTVSLRAYLYPLLAQTFGVPAACKAKRYIALLFWASAALPVLHASMRQQHLGCRRHCSGRAGWRKWRTIGISNPEVLAAAYSDRWTVPLSSEGLCWNLTTCLPALLDHTHKREAISPQGVAWK